MRDASAGVAQWLPLAAHGVVVEVLAEKRISPL
jgi:hypothetical protein